MHRLHTFSQKPGYDRRAGCQRVQRHSCGSKSGVRCSLTISTAFGCAFQGEVQPEQVIRLVERVAADNTYEIALADTTAALYQVADLFSAVMEIAPDANFRAHFHNTRNTGLANCYAAVEAGVGSIDASVEVAAAHLHPAQPATSHLRTWSICSLAWVLRQEYETTN